MRKESSTNFENEQILKDYCNAFKTLHLIEGRWKLSILFALYANSCTYTDIKNVLPNVSDRILSLRLKELQEDLLIQKNRLQDKDFYELTDRGLRLQNVLKTLSDWSKLEEENCE